MPGDLVKELLQRMTVTDRKQSLDVLRGIAVLLVLICHYSPVFVFGGLGVDLFFVLSGFLISGLLFSEFKATGTVNVKRFWIRRGFKIYPPFYTFLLVTALALLAITGGVPHEILADIFFLQNYLPRLWMHGWSLAVEEHFYFALPLLFLFLLFIGRNKPNPFRPIPMISLVLSVLCLWLRIRVSRYAVDWDQVFAPTHLRIDSLFAGVTLGYYSHFDPDSFREARRVWVLLVGCFLVIMTSFMPGTVAGVTFAYVGFTCIVAWAATRKHSQARFLRLVAWVGYYSYSIYLWHAVTQVTFNVLLGRLPHWVRFPAYVTFTIFLGVAMAKLIEVPSLKVRNKLFPSLASTRTQSAQASPAVVGAAILQNADG
jgi:peptidoglycan/LPS O-acetylase OafA/YrhL